jgi:hypothetical protein
LLQQATCDEEDKAINKRPTENHAHQAPTASAWVKPGKSTPAALEAGWIAWRARPTSSAIRFVLQQPTAGNQGWLVWGQDHLAALIDWRDQVVSHGLRHRIKYARPLCRKDSSPRAKGADRDGIAPTRNRPWKARHTRNRSIPPGQETVGLALGPSSIAIVPLAGHGTVGGFLCAALAPNSGAKRRPQCKLE